MATCLPSGFGPGGDNNNTGGQLSCRSFHMTLLRKLAGAASLFAVAALMVAAFSASSANAQAANPMQVFGLTGAGAVVEGDVVEAPLGGEVVGTATLTAG